MANDDPANFKRREGLELFAEARIFGEAIGRAAASATGRKWS
jgi:hypothetical protein